MELHAQQQHWATVTQTPQCICKQRVAKDHGTTCATETQSNIDAAIPIRVSKQRAAKKIEVHAQRQRRATVTQPLHSNVGKTEASPGQSLLQNRISAPKPKKVWFWSFLKRRLKGKWKAPKTINIRKPPRATSTHFLRACPQNTESWWKLKMWNEAFVRDNVPHKWKLKMWKRSFHAGRPSKTESWRCENKAFVRDVPQ